MPGFMVIIEMGRNLKIKPKTTAKEIFDKGPATETFISPHFLSRKLYGFTGTGFAQPNKTGLPAINKSKGKIIEPNGSKCFKGFKVSLPSYFAVGSPKLEATYPWASSWIITEKSKTIKEKIVIASVPIIFIDLYYYVLQKNKIDGKIKNIK